MKKLLIFFTTISLLASCGSSKTVRDSKKVLKGEWTLNTITYDTSGEFKVTLLNDVSKECFEGSSWQFIPNNNTGSYAINKLNCSAGIRHFIFTVQEVNAETGLYHFLLKPTDVKGKSETNRGFRLKLSALSETNMEWQQTVTLDGKPFVINMNFIKSTDYEN